MLHRITCHIQHDCNGPGVAALLCVGRAFTPTPTLVKGERLGMIGQLSNLTPFGWLVESQPGLARKRGTKLYPILLHGRILGLSHPRDHNFHWQHDGHDGMDVLAGFVDVYSKFVFRLPHVYSSHHLQLMFVIPRSQGSHTRFTPTPIRG